MLSYGTKRAERWPSGLRRRFAKPLYGQKLYPGFKSLPLRQTFNQLSLKVKSKSYAALTWLQVFAYDAAAVASTDATLGKTNSRNSALSKVGCFSMEVVYKAESPGLDCFAPLESLAGSCIAWSAASA